MTTVRAEASSGAENRYADLIPVNLITGFLGSGKTTLLQRLLDSPTMHNAAVIINEFGEISLDHLILHRIDGEVAVLQSGCICCTIRSDLAETIRELHDKRARGLIPTYDRILIETTGLADPAPIVSTLSLEPAIRHHYRLGTIVATFDAVNARRHLGEHPETRKQLAVADRILLTKTDLADSDCIAQARESASAINPTASILDTGLTGEMQQLLGQDICHPESRSDEVQSWFREAVSAHDHHGDIDSHTIVINEALDWTEFGLWLLLLLHAHGEKLLRVKGILNVEGEDSPVVFHGVQHTIHPPQHLENWPSDDHRSRIVFIARGLDLRQLERSFRAFSQL